MKGNICRCCRVPKTRENIMHHPQGWLTVPASITTDLYVTFISRQAELVTPSATSSLLITAGMIRSRRSILDRPLAIYRAI